MVIFYCDHSTFSHFLPSVTLPSVIFYLRSFSTFIHSTSGHFLPSVLLPSVILRSAIIRSVILRFRSFYVRSRFQNLRRTRLFCLIRLRIINSTTLSDMLFFLFLYSGRIKYIPRNKYILFRFRWEKIILKIDFF